jgi:diadenosine tetraphosphate (Ap4A) HIT family hydrolase
MKYSEFLEKERPCPFCNAEPKNVIAENKHAYLTYAIAPYHKDHLLVVPKRHIEHILDISDSEMEDIDHLQNKAWKAIQKIGYTSVSYIVREGTKSGRSVTHIHYHIIPEVRIGDVDHNGMQRRILEEEEITELVERVKNLL